MTRGSIGRCRRTSPLLGTLRPGPTSMSHGEHPSRDLVSDAFSCVEHSTATWAMVDRFTSSWTPSTPTWHHGVTQLAGNQTPATRYRRGLGGITVVHSLRLIPTGLARSLATLASTPHLAAKGPTPPHCFVGPEDIHSERRDIVINHRTEVSYRHSHRLHPSE